MSTRSLPHPPQRHTPLYPAPASAEFPRLLEQTEAAVWADLFRCATPEETRALGLRLGQLGPVTAMAAAATDVLALNRAVGLGVGGPATERQLDAVRAWFADAGSPRYFVQVAPAAAPEVHGWLAARGFRHHNSWVKLYRPMTDLPEAHTDLRIEPAGPRHADAFARLVVPAFDWPEAMGGPFARTVGRPRWSHYLAFDADEPVAAAGLFLHGHVAYLGPAATLPSYRGRGAQSALIARRLRDAAARGAALAITETAEERPERPVVPSFRNMRRLGFSVAYHRPNYLFTQTD